MLIARQGLAKPFGLLSLLLSQGCILLYQGEGDGGASASAGAGPGGGGTGGAAAGGSAAGGAEVGGGGAGGGPAGGGGAGGDYGDGGPPGDWLVDVGTFNNGGGPDGLGRFQSMVAMPNGNILVGGYSGAGFTTANSDVITPNTFFLLELDALGVLSAPRVVPFLVTGISGVEPSISVNSRGQDLYAVISNTSQLELFRLDNEEATSLLGCTSQINGLKLGSLASNGDQLLLAMQLSGTITCTTPKPSSCDLTADAPSTVLWPVEDNNDLDCAKHIVVPPQPGDSYFTAPRIALGPVQGGNLADLLVTAYGGTTNGFSHRRARSTMIGTTINPNFNHAEIGPHRQPPLPVIPAVFQTSGNGVDTAIIGGSRGGVMESQQFFIARASGGQANDGSHYVDGTSAQLAALYPNEDTLLAVGEYDQIALNELAVPGVTCGVLCAGWLAFGQDLKVVAHRIAKGPSVRSRSGILVGQVAYWTGDSFNNFELGCDSLMIPADGPPHAFVARNALPLP